MINYIAGTILFVLIIIGVCLTSNIVNQCDQVNEQGWSEEQLERITNKYFEKFKGE